jgi:predicted enzyme related to lactoylglutathione lyase
LVFVNVPEAKRVKNRVHLDIVADGSQTAELARLQALGARVIDDRRDVSPGGWVVLADPEGNEFDLEGGE